MEIKQSQSDHPESRQMIDTEDSEQLKLFRTAFNLMPQLGWTARADGYIDFYNKQWIDYTGLTADQLEGWGWERVHDPRYLPEIKKRWLHSIETGSEFNMEFPLRAADGSFQWFLTRVTPLKSGNHVVRWVGINTNIDAERRLTASLEQKILDRSAEVARIGNILSSFVESGNVREASKQILHEALQLTESEYGFVGVTVPGGPQGTTLRILADEGFNWSQTENRSLYEKIVIDYQAKGYIEFPMLDNLFGWPILHGKPIITNEPYSDPRRSGRVPKGHPPIQNFLGLPILKGEQVVGTFGIANRAGGFSEDQVAALQMVAKTIAVIYESYRRMSQEQVLIADRKLAEENLRQANQALIDLAYTVSHELQEPLAVIRSQLNLLSARYVERLGADADGYISASINSSRVVERIIDDLWEYARIDLPHIKFEAVNFEDVFDEAAHSIDREIKARNVLVSRSSLPELFGDRRQLVLLVKQLMLNAINFNQSSQPTIVIETESLGDEIEFCISDNGIGFDPAEAGEIFKMFRRLVKSTPGTGMGLSVCKKIVEFHGGKIWAESTAQGSKFHFTIPLVPAH